MLYLGITLTNQNCIHEEIKSKLKSGMSTTIWSRIFHLQFPIQNYKDGNIQKCDFVVLYGCETWSITLRWEHKLRVFENWVLKKIFGPLRVELTGDWWIWRDGELHILYSSTNII